MKRERRHFPRAAQSFETRYRSAGELITSWNRATVINLGAGGMRIRSADMMQRGTVLDVELTLPSQQQAIRLRGRVIWNRMEAAGVMEYGIEFMDMTATQQVQLDELVRFMGAGGAGPGAAA